MNTIGPRSSDRSLPINIKIQLDAAHQSPFPFSSPSIEDDFSIHTGSSSRTRINFDSPNTTITGYEPGLVTPLNQPSPVRHAATGALKNHPRQRQPAWLVHHPAGQKPDLSLITNFSKPSRPRNNLVVDEVVARHANQNRVQSIVSHRGVEITADGDDHPENEFGTVTGTLPFECNVQHGTSIKYKTLTTRSRRDVATSRSSIVIGLSLPESEAAAHRQPEIPQSAITLHTPVTPALFITPPESQVESRGQLEIPPGKADFRRAASSIYSQLEVVPRGSAELPGGAPPTPRQGLRPLMSRNPFLEKDPETLFPPEPDHDRDVSETRFSQESERHILAGPAGSIEPKSQGWWNLLLSPLLSRAASLTSRKTRDESPTIPPVPHLPEDVEKIPAARTPYSAISPETPRRQGLASPGTSTWSHWTDWENESSRSIAIRQDSEDGEFVPPKRDKINQADASTIPYTQPTEGLAAEYYHAAAVEQLAGVTFFPCVGHSCAQRLPKLQSIYDAPREKKAVLASPFTEKAVVRPAPPATITPMKPTSPISTVFEETPHQHLINGIKSKSPDEVSEPERGTMSTSKTAPSLASQSSRSRIEGHCKEPQELSPHVRKATTAAILRAKALNSPTRSKGSSECAVIAPACPKPPVFSPLSACNQATTSRHLIAGSPFFGLPATPRPVRKATEGEHRGQNKPFVTGNTSYPNLPTRPANAPVTITDIKQDREVRRSIEARRQRYEREDRGAHTVGGLWRGRGFVPENGCFGRSGREGRKKRRCMVWILAILLSVIILCVVLATTLTRHGDATPIQSQWLNLTGYPPMPTGISTIAQPALTQSDSQCFQLSTMWSCSVPKENVNTTTPSPNASDQPNFRFEILFQNGTVPVNMTTSLERRSSSGFFVANPTVPSDADQIFLGQTTDNVTSPFEGELTPFFITFMSTSPVVPSSYSSVSSQKRDLLASVPAPALAPDGSVAPANLLPNNPYFISQPIKLYNRGLPDEHYGFYNYYTKSIYLSGFTFSNSSSQDGTDTTPADSATPVPLDQNGGSPESAASAVCYFAQTRFLVKMYTRLNPSTQTPAFGSLLGTPIPIPAKGSSSALNSSATDFAQPGSFPYPTTIILDRHGGDVNAKVSYCYGLDNDQVIQTDKGFLLEERGVGGTLINPAPGLFSNSSSSGSSSDGGDGSANGSGSAYNSSLGGMDGGTGGCGCTWQNWH